MPDFSHIAPFYGVLFPARADQLDFLQGAGNAPSMFADIACGTGQQLEALCDRGMEVWGIDLDDDMIELLKKRRPDLSGNVVTGDMREADRLLGNVMPGRADVVYCIGNSLVQLTDTGDIQRILNACAALLEPGGVFVGQIVNFDRVLGGDYDLLPTIERSLPSGESCVLERAYLPSQRQGCVRFRTRLSTSQGTQEKEHELYALSREEFEELLTKASFSSLEWFGDYKGNAWTPDSSATIVRGLTS